MPAPPYSLTYSDTTQLTNIVAQIDAKILIQYAGVPTGNVAAGVVGQFAINLNDNSIWVCTATDATGTPSGTTWLQTNLIVVNASTSTPGIIQLATQTEVNTGTNNTKAVVPSTLASAYARNGANNDITSLNATFSTPLGQGNGGTGAATFLAALLANLPTPFAAGSFLSNDGTNLLWSIPTPSLQLISSNGSLSYETYNLVTANTLILTLPTGVSNKVGQPITVVFAPSVTTGPTINTGNSGADLVMGAAGPLNINNVDRGFIATWTGATYGWFIQGFDI